MRSWLAQSLTTLEDMVDSGELTEEEVQNLAKASLAVRGLSLSLAPLPLPPDESGAHPIAIDASPESSTLRPSMVVPRALTPDGSTVATPRKGHG